MQTSPATKWGVSYGLNVAKGRRGTTHEAHRTSCSSPGVTHGKISMSYPKLVSACRIVVGGCMSSQQRIRCSSCSLKGHASSMAFQQNFAQVRRGKLTFQIYCAHSTEPSQFSVLLLHMTQSDKSRILNPPLLKLHTKACLKLDHRIRTFLAKKAYKQDDSEKQAEDDPLQM